MLHINKIEKKKLLTNFKKIFISQWKTRFYEGNLNILSNLRPPNYSLVFLYIDPLAFHFFYSKLKLLT